MFNTNTGTANVGVGYKSMYNNTTGKNNTAVGSYALYDNTTGNANSAFGNLALVSNTTGNSNSAFGEGALRFNTTGKNNIAIGTNALANNTVGENNTASGQAALKNNTTGFYNAAFGTQSLQGNSDGYFNTAIGFYAGRYIANGTTLNTTSDLSVYLGSGSKASADGEQNEIVIGYNAIGAGSNTVQLGNTDIANVKTSGTITAGTITYPNTFGSANQVLTTDGSGVASWSTAVTSVTEADDEIIAVDPGQTSFVLSQTPAATSKVKMYINGIRISKAAYSISVISLVPTLTYDPNYNGFYAISVGDRVQFEYSTSDTPLTLN
jgi:hypothetical protein